jgi:hypothetical protein
MGRIVFVGALAYACSQPALSQWRPAALNQSIVEFRRTFAETTNDGYRTIEAFKDLWSMRRVDRALRDLNSAL